jgi:membrane protein YqaA with SNARE-associated domain
MMNMYADATYIPVDIAAATVMASLMGGAIGWFLGFNRKEG